MSFVIPEPDWKRFRKLHAVVLERFCAQILDELSRVAVENGPNAHERYLKVYKLIHDRDEVIGDVFNDFRRSTALFQLALMLSKGIIQEDELAEFSTEVQQSIRLYLRR